MIKDGEHHVGEIHARINDQVVVIANQGTLVVRATTLPTQALPRRTSGQGYAIYAEVMVKDLVVTELPNAAFNIYFSLNGKQVRGLVTANACGNDLVKFEGDALRLSCIAALRGL